MCRLGLECCDDSGSFLSLYMGFAANGVNREYPGVGAAVGTSPSHHPSTFSAIYFALSLLFPLQNFAAVLPYDPRQESWYQEALAQPLLIGSSRNRVPAYSASYYDPYVAQVPLSPCLVPFPRVRRLTECACTDHDHNQRSSAECERQQLVRSNGWRRDRA